MVVQLPNKCLILRSQEFLSVDNTPSFVVTRESSNIAKMSYKAAANEGIQLANNSELSDAAKGEIMAQLMVDNPTNFLAVMEGLENGHGDGSSMTAEDRMMALGMNAIVSDHGRSQLLNNIMHGNYDSGKPPNYLERGVSSIARGVSSVGSYSDDKDKGDLAKAVGVGVGLTVGAAALSVGIALSPLALFGKGVYKLGSFVHRKITGRTPLKIRREGSRHKIIGQALRNMAGNPSSMGL